MSNPKDSKLMNTTLESAAVFKENYGWFITPLALGIDFDFFLCICNYIENNTISK